MRFSKNNLRSIMVLFVMIAFSKSYILAEERVYYIAAEEIVWDYAPQKHDMMMGTPMNEEHQVFLNRESDKIGSSYKKALFIEYTDSSFTQKKPVPKEWSHKAILGPVIRASVGDTIKIIFKNKALRAYSMHPHGVFYDKSSEGAMTNDGTSKEQKRDDKIAPGEMYTYIWEVPERAGPSSKDGSSIAWLYHSHLSEPKDTNSGLIGVILITDPKRADSEAKPTDIDREFIVLFKVFDENQSWYLEENIDNLAKEMQISTEKIDLEDDDFIESNLMHAVNGRLLGDWPMPVMYKGERVRWYVIGFGNEVDMHTAHWHGNTALVNGHRLDTVSVFPASIVIADMIADNPGIWMFHCHVDDHLSAGMTGRYQVLEAKK